MSPPHAFPGPCRGQPRFCRMQTVSQERSERPHGVSDPEVCMLFGLNSKMWHDPRAHHFWIRWRLRSAHHHLRVSAGRHRITSALSAQSCIQVSNALLVCKLLLLWSSLRLGESKKTGGRVTKGFLLFLLAFFFFSLFFLELHPSPPNHRLRPGF